MFLYKLTRYLKLIHPGTNKAPTPERTKLADGLCILELSADDFVPPADMVSGVSSSLLLHVGNVNFKTWEICMPETGD